MTQATAYESDDFIRIVKNRGTVPVSQIIGRTYIKTYFDTLYEPIGGGGTGWQTVTETWTRTGNHTFTIATDLTTKYQKGTKIRYKDGGAFEYGVIGAATYSAPNTTVTLITNTDYLMAAATITDTAISYQAMPQGFPGWFNWDPAPAGAFDARTKLLLGNGVTNSASIGLHVGDSGNSNRLLMNFNSNPSTQNFNLAGYTYTGGTNTQRGSTWNVPGNEIYLRITRDGSNNCSFYFSVNGILWQLVATQSFTFTVANLGYRITQAAALTHECAADWLRTDV